MGVALTRAVLIAGLLVVSGCKTTTTKSTTGTRMAAFDAEVLRALKDRDIGAFVQSLPPTKEPEKKMVDSSYELADQSEGGMSYVVLIRRSTHQIWIRRSGGGTTEVYGPATYNMAR
jgi:hypothetical protein